MKKRWLALLLGGAVLAAPARAGSGHVWQITSPDHDQTYTYGSERGRQWILRGRHLELAIHFTNDPYVDRIEPREYDDFTFDFPNVRLGSDGRTFYYHPAGGRPVAVATRGGGLFGAEVRLLPSNFLSIDKPHGYLTLTLVVTDRATATASD